MESNRTALDGPRGRDSRGYARWWIGTAVLLLHGLSAPPAALAQAGSFGTAPALRGGASRVVAFPTQADGVLGAEDVDHALRSALEARKLSLAPAPALDLDATQLALDCLDTTARCLRQVAERTHGDVLIAPRLQRRADRLELRILYFAVSDDESRFAARRAAGKRLDADTVNAIPAMVDELMGAAKASAAPEADAPLPAPEAESAPAADAPNIAIADNAVESGSHRRLPIVPLVLAGSGVVLVGVGALMGALMSDTQRDYERQPVTTMDEAEAADALRERGKRQALIADVLFGVGGAAIAAGGVWLVLSLTHEQPQTAIVPELGPDRAGLRIAGQWSGL